MSTGIFYERLHIPELILCAMSDTTHVLGH